MRNGGRHCCQPPLRRASDLPVFARLVPCGTRLRSWPTSSGVASRKTLLPHREPFSPAGRPTPSRGPILTAGSAIASARLPAEPRFGCPPSSRRCRLPVGRRHRRPDFGPGVGPATATECLPFRGPSWDDRSFQPHRPRPKAKPRMPHERDHLFRRLSPAMLPKVQRRSLPGVACLHRSSSGACRRRSGVLARPVSPSPLRAPEVSGRGCRPRSPKENDARGESHQADSAARALWIAGIWRVTARFRRYCCCCRSVPPGLPLSGCPKPPPSRSPSPPISMA